MVEECVADNPAALLRIFHTAVRETLCPSERNVFLPEDRKVVKHELYVAVLESACDASFYRVKQHGTIQSHVYSRGRKISAACQTGELLSCRDNAALAAATSEYTYEGYVGTSNHPLHQRSLTSQKTASLASEIG